MKNAITSLLLVTLIGSMSFSCLAMSSTEAPRSDAPKQLIQAIKDNPLNEKAWCNMYTLLIERGRQKDSTALHALFKESHIILNPSILGQRSNDEAAITHYLKLSCAITDYISCAIERLAIQKDHKHLHTLCLMHKDVWREHWQNNMQSRNQQSRNQLFAKLREYANKSATPANNDDKATRARSWLTPSSWWVPAFGLAITAVALGACLHLIKKKQK